MTITEAVACQGKNQVKRWIREQIPRRTVRSTAQSLSFFYDCQVSLSTPTCLSECRKKHPEIRVSKQTLKSIVVETLGTTQSGDFDAFWEIWRPILA